jgi:hypothetical protein
MSEEVTMPAKTKAKAKKPLKPAKKAPPKAKKAPALECEVCGYRVIVDQSCGCVEEHVLLCCGEPMKKV